MVNEQGECEGDSWWDVVENNIGLTNYAPSVDLIYNYHKEHQLGTTVVEPTIIKQEMHSTEVMQRASLYSGKYDNGKR